MSDEKHYHHEYDKPWRRLVLEWLFNQGVSTVLLIINVTVMVYFFNYALQTAIPAHLSAIQAGYDRNMQVMGGALKQLEAAHTSQIEHMNEAHTAQIKYIVDSYRRDMDRP